MLDHMGIDWLFLLGSIATIGFMYFAIFYYTIRVTKPKRDLLAVNMSSGHTINVMLVVVMTIALIFQYMSVIVYVYCFSYPITDTIVYSITFCYYTFITSNAVIFLIMLFYRFIR